MDAININFLLGDTTFIFYIIFSTWHLQKNEKSMKLFACMKKKDKSSP